MRSKCVWSASGAALVNVQMMVPWDDEIAFGEIPERDGLCRFGLEVYPRKEVLNSRISEVLHFRYRGHLVEGWILGYGLNPIPEEYGTGIARCQLSFVDALNQQISETVELAVLRTSKPMQTHRGTGLYAVAEIDHAGRPQGRAGTTGLIHARTSRR